MTEIDCFSAKFLEDSASLQRIVSSDSDVSLLSQVLSVGFCVHTCTSEKNNSR